MAGSKALQFASVMFALTCYCVRAKSRYSLLDPETLNSMRPVSMMLLKG